MFSKFGKAMMCSAIFVFGMSSAPAHPASVGEQLLERYVQKKVTERQEEQSAEGSKEGFYEHGKGEEINETLDERTFITYLPSTYKPDQNNLPLLIVLHGGMGSAKQIKRYIGLDPLADQHNFVLAYLDGTKVAKRLSDRFKGWNAGGCCGVPEEDEVDDIGFIEDVIDYMHRKYDIDKNRVFGTGHSNGAMMTQRVICETDLYKDAITMSGTLQMDIKKCPKAKGSRILNLHGAEDKNLPYKGGYSTEGINKRTEYKSQEYTKDVFKKSGVKYETLIFVGADHSPNTLNEAVIKKFEKTLPETIVDYLGLDNGK